MKSCFKLEGYPKKRGDLLFVGGTCVQVDSKSRWLIAPYIERGIVYPAIFYVDQKEFMHDYVYVTELKLLPRNSINFDTFFNL